MKLTLLGFSDLSTILLTEIASDRFGIHPDNLKVEVVCNLAFDERVIRESWPLPQAQFTVTPKAHWQPPKAGGTIMPGLMSAMACEKMMEDFVATTPLRLEDLSVVIHPRAVVASSVKIKPGTWIHPNACISSMTEIGHCVNVNRNAAVGHHNVLEDFVYINPGAQLGGLCTIGRGSTIGIGATCLDRKTIGSRAFVGAGSVVTQNVPDGVTVVGVPAKPLAIQE
jgi:sugar O-acyltransferase (sialic acid O-acetyltransferase NeuD family)